jgi:hypothetical protein
MSAKELLREWAPDRLGQEQLNAELLSDQKPDFTELQEELRRLKSIGPEGER